MKRKTTETLYYLKTEQNIDKNIDINKIIAKRNLKSNLFKTHNSFFCFKRIKYIILFLIIITIIICLIITLFIYSQERNKKIKISYESYVNITDNIDGYYIPKDGILNPTYKKCSVENCKKCYGNSLNDTCISCFDSYKAIRNEKDKIISCEYNPEKEEDKNITFKESDTIYITNYISSNEEDKNITFEESDTIYITNYISSNIEKTFELQTDSSETELITAETVINCEPGYYLPEGNNLENSCRKCSVIGC